MSAPLLQVERAARNFGGLIAVRDVDLELQAGEILGLIGPNGSGKSTLISLIAGQRRPSGGRIRLNGRDLTNAGAAAMCRAGLSRTFQLVRVPPHLSALDNVAAAAMFGRERAGVAEARQRAEELLALVGFRRDAMQPAGELTYFDQKQVELARALASGPDVLMLDEWLAGLTPTELQDGIDLLRRLNAERGLALIVVEHVMAAIRALCRRVVVLSEGSVIAAGDTDTCLQDPAVIEVYLGRDDA